MGCCGLYWAVLGFPSSLGDPGDPGGPGGNCVPGVPEYPGDPVTEVIWIEGHSGDYGNERHLVT